MGRGREDLVSNMKTQFKNRDGKEVADRNSTFANTDAGGLETYLTKGLGI